MGDGAADGTGQGEAGVEVEAGRRAGGVGLGLLDDGVNLGHGGRFVGGLRLRGIKNKRTEWRGKSRGDDDNDDERSLGEKVKGVGCN